MLGDPIDPPDGFNYDLWLNGAQHEPCRPNLVQRRWRSWWNYGGGQITDWVVHLTDVLFYAFPELPGQASESAFMEAALAAKLLVVPGSAFSRRDTHVRLSFAASDEVLQRGLRELNQLAERLA